MESAVKHWDSDLTFLDGSTSIEDCEFEYVAILEDADWRCFDLMIAPSHFNLHCLLSQYILEGFHILCEGGIKSLGHVIAI